MKMRRFCSSLDLALVRHTPAVVLVLADQERHTVRVQPPNRLLVLTVKLNPDAVELQD
jgi:hypothetical protein